MNSPAIPKPSIADFARVSLPKEHKHSGTLMAGLQDRNSLMRQVFELGRRYERLYPGAQEPGQDAAPADAPAPNAPTGPVVAHDPAVAAAERAKAAAQPRLGVESQKASGK